MNIFDGIEKLINEHGSAKILGERLLLAKDQNAAQEKRILELESQLQKSDAEKKTISLQFQKCQTENKQLEQEIDRLQQDHDAPPRSDNDHKILELLAKQSNIPVEQIAQTLGRNLEQTKYELEELRKANFINSQILPYSIFNERNNKPITVWNLAHNGRGYMVKHGFLK